MFFPQAILAIYSCINKDERMLVLQMEHPKISCT